MSEYWIKGIGCVESADNLNGDLGHAGHVRDHYRQMLCRYLGLDDDDTFDEASVENWLREKEVPADEEDSYDDPINCFLDAHKKEDGAEARQLPTWADDYEQFEFAVFCALGSNSDVRCVEHAIKELGWIRVLGNNVQCWDYTQLHQITEGLWEIDSEGSEDDNYYIEVLSCRAFHECALKDIENLKEELAST